MLIDSYLSEYRVLARHTGDGGYLKMKMAACTSWVAQYDVINVAGHRNSQASRKIPPRAVVGVGRTRVRYLLAW